MSGIQLYKLADEYLLACDQLSELDMPPEVVADTLESLQGDIQTKATNIGMFIRTLEVTAAGLEEAEKEIARRKRATISRISEIKDYLLHNMQRTGISKIESPYISISLKKNPPKVDILQSGAVPQEFMRQEEAPPPSPDKKAIADYLKQGNTPAWACFSQSERVEIK